MQTQEALDGPHPAGTRARTNRVIDVTLRRCVPGFGVDRRWLKERLAELDVRTHLSEGCLQELVNDADSAAWRRVAGTGCGLRYLDVLREEIIARAEFIHRWTGSDERIDASVNGFAELVRIARKYALPRPWKVPEPVAAQCTRRAPSYWRWASTAESESARPFSAGAV
ncbi:MAG TPA: hypothetical protein VGI35_05655 [Steroidobacteraceae bacterium]